MNVSEMKNGGKQLLELLRHHIALDDIERCRYYLKIADIEWLVIKVWVAQGGSMAKTIAVLREEYLVTADKTALGRLFLDMLHKLRHRINMEPAFDERGKLIEQYSFIKYECYEVEGTDYRVVTTSIHPKTFWTDQPTTRDREKFERMFIYRLRNGRWVKTSSRYAQTYLSAMKLLKNIQ
jgi:hypothetical protein